MAGGAQAQADAGSQQSCATHQDGLPRFSHPGASCEVLQVADLLLLQVPQSTLGLISDDDFADGGAHKPGCGNPMCSNIRRTIRFRPECRVTSTMVREPVEPITQQRSAAIGPSSSSIPDWSCLAALTGIFPCTSTM